MKKIAKTILLVALPMSMLFVAGCEDDYDNNNRSDYYDYNDDDSDAWKKNITQTDESTANIEEYL